MSISTLVALFGLMKAELGMRDTPVDCEKRIELGKFCKQLDNVCVLGHNLLTRV